MLPYIYTDISNQLPRVHACTLAIRMQDIVFLSDINFQGCGISTHRIRVDVQLVQNLSIRRSCSFILLIAITQTIHRRRNITVSSAAVRALRHGVISIESLCCIPFRPGIDGSADIYEQDKRRRRRYHWHLCYVQYVSICLQMQISPNLVSTVMIFF